MAGKKFSLTMQIMVALVAGIVVGLIINATAMTVVDGKIVPIDSSIARFIDEYINNGLFDAIGQIFVRALKMLVVPIVFVSLVCGVCSLKDIRKLGRVGGWTMLLYLLTTALAISIALFLANIIDPGQGFDLSSQAKFDPGTPATLKDVFIDLISPNPIKSMVEGNMLQIITFAILFGLAVVKLGERGQRVIQLFDDTNEIFMRLIMILMLLAPYGVFCLIAKVFATQGFSAFEPLLKYAGVVLLALAVHVAITYGGMLRFIGGLNPLTFFRKMEDPVVFAFSTASSNATLPITLETCEYKLGADNSIASFTVPLGATINMDGTAIMQGCATVFIAQAYGIDLSFTDYLMVILTATLASIGTAGVPGVGLVMLSMVLDQVGLPVEGIGYILGIDRILDMCRTAVNICGDAAVTCVVAKKEGNLNEAVFNGREVDAGEMIS